MWIYSFGILAYELLIRLVSPFNVKAKQWTDGRKDIFRRIREAVKSGDRIVWIHSASLGEFEQGRPIIEAIRSAHPGYKIFLTFFSPSGYEIRKNYQGADYIFYLPSDRPGNVRRFLDAVHPEIAVFVKYEFWLNYLSELKRRQVRTFIVSSIFRRDSVFFKPWGGAWRNILNVFETIFVQDSNSKDLLSELGFDNVIVAGDTRFDRVAQIASAAKQIPQLESFRSDRRMFIAGSTWGPDEEILIELINANPEIKFLIAPHEMEENRIARILENVKGGALRYTSFSEERAKECQVLVLDTIGILSSAYGYAEWAYIGGGFGVGIHNTLEAATFGLPLAFGPNYHKFKEARDLVALQAASSICSYTELEAWFTPLRDSEELRQEASVKAKEYTSSHQGATQTILGSIF